MQRLGVARESKMLSYLQQRNCSGIPIILRLFKHVRSFSLAPSFVLFNEKKKENISSFDEFFCFTSISFVTANAVAILISYEALHLSY